MNVEKALIFAEREGFRALELDLYRPDTSDGVAHPVVVYIHGGGWRVSHRSRAPRETRGWDRGFFERLTDAGFVVAAPDYRLSAEAIFPAQIDDVVEALGWLRDRATELVIDAGRLLLWGASGGGHLAALAAVTAEAPPVSAVVCWYPVTDITALDLDATASFEAHLLGGPIGEHLDLARAASPALQVRDRPPPFLIQHGDADMWVPHDQGVRLAEALRAAGGSVEFESVPGADHFFDGHADVEGIFDRALAFLVNHA